MPKRQKKKPPTKVVEASTVRIVFTPLVEHGVAKQKKATTKKTIKKVVKKR